MKFETWLQDRNRSQEDEVDKCLEDLLVTMDHWLSVFLVELLVNPTINPASATGSEKSERYVETGSEKTEQPTTSSFYH